MTSNVRMRCTWVYSILTGGGKAGSIFAGQAAACMLVMTLLTGCLAARPLLAGAGATDAGRAAQGERGLGSGSSLPCPCPYPAQWWQQPNVYQLKAGSQ